MTSEENARLIAFYNAARAEVVQRLGLREQVLLASLATSGVVAGIAYKNSPSPFPSTLLLIAVLSGPFSLAFIRHEWIAGKLGSYIVNDLRPLMINLSDGTAMVDWDGSRALHRGLVVQLFLEKILFCTLLIGPSLVTLWLCRYCIQTGYRGLFVTGCISVGGACAIFLFELVRLRGFYKSTSHIRADRRRLKS
jgi:hypothetical protein